MAIGKSVREVEETKEFQEGAVRGSDAVKSSRKMKNAHLLSKEISLNSVSEN